MGCDYLAAMTSVHIIPKPYTTITVGSELIVTFPAPQQAQPGQGDHHD
jgi:hypothetical protein